MKKVTLMCLFAFFLLHMGGLGAATINDLDIYTEHYPPYNYEENGKLMGIGPDLMIGMLERVNSKLMRKDIKLVPWAQGYKKVQEDVNTCLFSTTRTKARENLFKWVGPIAPTTIGLLARKESKIKINSIEDIKKYKIGVIRSDIGELLLVNAGIDKGNLDATAKNITNITKLNMGRVDLLSYEQNVIKWDIKLNGFNLDDYETVYVQEESFLYYAFQKDTDNTIIQELQKALDAMVADGSYQKILNKYLK